MGDPAAITPGLDPAPRPIFRKRRDNDERRWTADEDRKIADIVSLGICNGQRAFKDALPDRRFANILDRRDQLLEAGLCKAPKPL